MVIGALASFCALHAAVAAEPFTAGERHLTTTSPAAAVRNGGDPTLRLTVWYPAAAPETEVKVGPPGAPIFLLGAVAKDAPFADGARRPVVLLSHGFGGSARQLTWLGAALARHGYVAVAVDHPGTNSLDGVSDVGAYTPWTWAEDLHAALDLVLERPDLASHLDPARIGVAGFALGAYAALLDVGARSSFAHFAAFCEGPRRDAMCGKQLEYPLDNRGRLEVLARPAVREVAQRESAELRDPRVRAVFLVAPAFMQALTPASLGRVRVPVEIVLGEADPIAPNDSNGERVARLIPGARLKVLPGVGHYDFLSRCGPAGLKAVGPLCVDGPGPPRAETHETTQAAAAAFFDRTLAGRRRLTVTPRANTVSPAPLAAE